MSARNLVLNILYVLVLIILFPVIIGGVLNTPVGLSYVETESMLPQLEPGDGFILVPDQLVSDYGVGDVITFNAQNLPYEYVTHRIVGETAQGFVTQGDNNAFSDQMGSFSEPYVKEEQIAGKLLVIGGDVVSIPYFGKLISLIGDSIRGLSNRFYSLLGIENENEMLGSIVMSLGILTIIALVSELLSRTFRRPRSMERKDARAGPSYMPYLFFVLFLLLASSVSIVSMGQDNLVDFVATEGNTSSRAVHIGDSVERYVEIGNNGIIPVYAYVSGQDGIIEVNESSYTLKKGESVRVPYIINSPNDTGYYREYINVDIYIGILPHSLTESMRSMNEYLPILFVDILAVMVSFPVFFLIRKELRTRDRSVPKRTRAKNVL
ncbi:MAG: signal peptidase I [Candidatus Methanofastidiosa archaeon]|nr:signal peptidase I [Candidatus Methanofastidiosa archaeon]